FRAFQGIGGAGLFAMAFIIIAELFPPSERGKYQGWVGAVFGISSVLGPWLGGLLTDHATDIIPGIAGWRWVFYVNIPFAALALWFIINKMPSYGHKNNENVKLDYLAALLLIMGLVPLIIVLQLNKDIYGWASPLILTLSALSFACLLLFYFRSKNSANPVLNLNLFKNTVFRTANPPTFLVGAAFMGILTFLPLFLINVQGSNATQAGLGMIPLSAGLLIASILAGQLVSKFHNYRTLLLIGLIIFLIGMYFLSTMDKNTTYTQILLYMFICGIGVGPAMPLYPLAIQNAVEPEVLGQATSANQFFRQIGGAIGASVLGALLASSLSSSFYQLQSDQQTSALSVEDLVQEGAVAVDRAFLEKEKQVTYHLKEWYAHGNVASKAFLLSTDIPVSVKKNIEERTRAQANLTASISDFQKESGAQLQVIKESIKEAFALAIQKLYNYLLYVVALAWLFTWFIQQLPLKKR